MFGGSQNQRGFFMCLTPVIRNYCFFGFFPLTPLIVATAPLFLPYILRCNTPQCCGTRQGRRLECFVLLRRKLQKLRNVLYSSSAHECAIGEVSARTEGLKTPSYQSVYTGHLTPSSCGHSPYIPFRNTEGERYASLCSRYRRY